MYLKANRPVHNGSLILAHIYWRHGMGLVAPFIPLKVGLSDVDHLVADVVPAYAAICTLALPKGFNLPFCILLRFVYLSVLLRSRFRDTGSHRRSLNITHLLYYNYLRSSRITLSPLSWFPSTLSLLELSSSFGRCKKLPE
jgi:hypothetical protein